MKKNLLIIFAAFSLLFIGSLGTVFAAPTTAPSSIDSAKTQACSGLDLLGSTSTCSTQTSGFTSIVQAILNILSIIVGIAAVVMIIIAGLKYVTSGGEANNLASAKNTLIFAIIGLVITALAQVIVNFVISKSSTP